MALSPTKLLHWILRAAAAVIALLLAAVYALSVYPLVLLGDAEYRAVLAGRGFFHDLAQSQPALPIPWQNLHGIGTLAAWLGNPFPEPLQLLLLFLLHAGVALLLLTIIKQIALAWFAPRNALLLIALVAAHPGVWQMVLSSPLQLLTAWLFLSAWQFDPADETHAQALGWRLLALSFCGAMGLLLSLVVAITGGIRVYRGNRTADALQWSALLAPLPAVMLVSLLSWQWGWPGGVQINQQPTLYSAFSLTEWLNGRWSEGLWQLLAWLSVAGLDLAWTIPLFGLLALWGWWSEWQENPARHHWLLSLALALGVLLLLGGFAPASVQEEGAPLVVILVLFLAVRAVALRPVATLPAKGAAHGLTAALFLISLLAWPGHILQIVRQAEYEHRLLTTFEEISGGLSNPYPFPVAIRYSPQLFAHLASYENVIPVGLRIAAYHLPPNQEAQAGFANNPQTLQRAALAFLYPTWQQIDGRPHLLQAPQEWITPPLPLAGEQTRQGNLLMVSSLESPADASPLGAPLSQGRQRRVGEHWHFEQGYQSSNQTGLAFGLQPTAQTSAQGLRSAGPSQAANPLRTGMLFSDPFVIEGEDFRFAANIPKPSTQTVFALAVYQSAPRANNQSELAVRHLFDRPAETPLLADRFFYIRPAQLRYDPNFVTGWRVVHALHHQSTQGWQRFRWPLDAWPGYLAMWILADRDAQSTLWIDDVSQWLRPAGLYWNFERGNYAQWNVEGEAFGDQPAMGAIANQQPVQGYQGNYLANSYWQGSDVAQGRLISEPFTIEFDDMRFLIGGGQDLERLHLALWVDEQPVLTATGRQSETLREVIWDLSPWRGQTAHIEIVDQSSGVWGHILVDEIEIRNNILADAWMASPTNSPQ
mgnify:FL=1